MVLRERGGGEREGERESNMYKSKMKTLEVSQLITHSDGSDAQPLDQP